MTKAADLANLIGNINAGGGGVNRNVIINGMMQVSQRGDSTGVTSAGYYACDRWKTDIGSAGTWSIAQSSTVPRDKGFSKSIKLDCTTANGSLSSGAYLIYQQRIEGQNLQKFAFGTSDAKPIVLSFYVKSNKTGTYHVNLYNVDGSLRMNGRTYTIDSADTWEFKTLRFDGDTGQNFDNDANSSLLIEWWLAGGTTYTSGSVPTAWGSASNAVRAAGLAVNLADSTSNEWLMTGAQLEIGQNPTEFEHEPFERTLTKCQRYFERMDDEGNSSVPFGVGYNESTSQGRGMIFFKTIKRVDPTISISAVSSFCNVSTGSTAEASALTFDSQLPWGCRYICTSSNTSLVDGGASLLQRFQNDATIEIDSEL